MFSVICGVPVTVTSLSKTTLAWSLSPLPYGLVLLPTGSIDTDVMTGTGADTLWSESAATAVWLRFAALPERSVMAPSLRASESAAIEMPSSSMSPPATV